MKVLIVGYGKLKYMPYADFYLRNIDLLKNDVHMVFWNRDLSEEYRKYQPVCYHEFKYRQESDVPLYKKIHGFLKFKRFLKGVLKQENFDKLIVLHSIPAFLIYKQLLKKYAFKYIFDYRDYSYEKISFFKKRIKRLSDCSQITFTSSDAYRPFLSNSDDKVITSHNILLDDLHHRNYIKTEYKKVRISFWGLIRDVKINLAIIDKIGKDSRFELHYYGRIENCAKELIDMVKKKDIQNVFFHGEYVPTDRYEFIKNTDLLHNLYKDINTMMAMGNKYYDGIIFRIPQLCTEDSFMGKRATSSNVGLECDPYSDSFCEAIYNYFKLVYSKDNFKCFKESCDAELESILKEYYDGCTKIKALFE